MTDLVGGPEARSGLEVRGITRAFKGIRALTGVDLTVARGQVLGLIGPNGAGKSTLVNIISGYDRPDTGTVRADGTDVTRLPAHVRSRRGIARTFQHGQTYAELSVRENVEVAALGAGRGRRRARADAERLMELLGCADRAEETARTLPHGLQRRLGVARALAMRPTYLLLDEPAAGLNEGEIGDFGRVVRGIVEEGEVGVLLIDHNMKLVMEVCDRVHVVVQGESFAEGTPAEIKGSDAVTEAYLGRRAGA